MGRLSLLSELKSFVMKKLVISSLILLTGLAFDARAQEAKIGFAQSDYILGLLPEAQAAQRDIAEFERKVSNRLIAMRQGLELAGGTVPTRGA